MKFELYRAARRHSWRQVWLVACAVAVLLTSGAGVALAETPDEQYEFAAGLYNQKLYTLAAEKLREFVRTHPVHPKTPLAGYQIAAAQYRITGENEEPDYNAVATAYEAALKKPAPTPEIAAAARLELGDAQFHLKRYQPALQTLSEFLRSTPAPNKDDAAWAQYWIAQSYQELGKTAEARAAFQKVVAQYGENTDVAPYSQYSLGVLAAAAGDHAGAASAYNTLLKRYPKAEVATEAKLRLADALLASKNFAEAQTHYRALLADADAAQWKRDALLGLGDAQFGAANFDEAAKQYGQAISLFQPEEKGRAAVQLQLGNSFYNAKQYEAAVKAYAPLLGSADANTAANALYFSGLSEQSLKRAAQAGAHFQKVVQLHPAHELAPRAALRLGDSYADAKENDRAIAAYKSVTAKYPQAPEAKEAQAALLQLEGAAANAQMAAVQAAFDAKNWKQAEQLAQALLEKKPAPALAEGALYLMGDAQRQAGDFAGAAQTLRQQIAAYPQGALVNEARLSLAWALLDAKNWSHAESAARAGLAGVATDAKAGDLRDRLHLALGEALLKNTTKANNAADAAIVFARVENSANKELAAQALYGAALALEQAKQWPTAAAKWGRYAEASADSKTKANAFLRQGLAWRDAKNAAAAVAAFDQSIAADPQGETAAQALYESAWLARELKQTENEAARWAKLAAQFPASKFAAEAHFQQGEVLSAAEKWNEAAAAYRRVTEKFPQSEIAPAASYKLGSAAYNAKQWPEAAAAFDKAAAAKQEFSLESLFWAGESWRQAGNLAQARTRYEPFLQGVSKSTPATHTQALVPSAQLGLGLSLAAAGDWPKAAATYQVGLDGAKGATAAELSFRLAQALAQQNKWKEAATQFLKVTISYPDSQWADEARWNAGHALEKSGDLTAASAVYTQLAERQPASQWTKQAQERLTALQAN